MAAATESARNLTDHNVIRRLRGGILFLLLGLALATVLEVRDVPNSQRLWLFLPFFLAGNAFFQAIFKTCGYSAALGLRHTEDGQERVADKELRRQARRTGAKQIAFSFLGALVLTLLFIAVG